MAEARTRPRAIWKAAACRSCAYNCAKCNALRAPADEQRKRQKQLQRQRFEAAKTHAKAVTVLFWPVLRMHQMGGSRVGREAAAANLVWSTYAARGYGIL